MIVAALTIIVKASVEIVARALVALAGGLVAALWGVVKSRLVLGTAIFVFSASGLAMVIGSRAVTGWSQAALLGFGTSFLIVGTVELGVLGVLNKIIDPDRTGSLIKDLGGNLSQRFDALEDWLGIPESRRTGFGGLEELRADRPDGGITDGGKG
jgi:hypothetical protein